MSVYYLPPDEPLVASFGVSPKNSNVPWPDKAGIEPAKKPKHGDLVSNLALVSAKAAGMRPRGLAAKMAEALRNEDTSLASVEVAGPGFLNVTFSPEFWRETIRRIDDAADRFGQATVGKGCKVPVEYVSANPPGPLPIGHGRGAAGGVGVLWEPRPAIAAGTLEAEPQAREDASTAPMLSKEMAEFKLTDSADHIHNWVRGMNPWPGAWFVTAGGRKLKVMECRVAESHGEAAGTVLATKPLTVACGEGAIQLLHVVPEGKKPMDGTSFAAGLRLRAGDSL